MLIGIISDTHDHARNLLKAIEIFNKKDVELVIHCGDWVSPFMPDFCKNLNCQIISVFGNNEGDKFRFLKRQQKNNWNIEFNNSCVEKKLDGKNIIAYHGDNPSILNALINSQKYDVIFFGHNHESSIEKRGNTLCVNPGTICEYSNSQIINNPTVAIYDTKINAAEIIKL
ncbi:MAG: metallophosphoesterase [Patescibacteria group bacterium]|nr:metallophosphoesterase [Patescibacteria group bacterium]MDD4610716.1 metallophosphoesterase [Patescibacteria group bacterium]